MKVKLHKPRQQMHLQREKDSNKCGVLLEAEVWALSTQTLQLSSNRSSAPRRSCCTAWVLLPVALCLVKMHCLLPTESLGGIWGGEKVIIPQKGKYNAISKHFQWNFRIHKHKDRWGIAATEFHPGKLLGSISFMLQVNATKIFQKLQIYSLH